MVGIGKGAEHNILIKDAESLELGYKVNALILDKTGTITEGKPKVTAMEWETEEGLEVYKQVLYSMELQSAHPLAEAVLNELKDQQVSCISSNFFECIPSSGVKAEYNGMFSYDGKSEERRIVNE